ncbi:fimbrial protein [Pseudescherichia vulneris]|jgi:type 1 fimbria pilin
MKLSKAFLALAMATAMATGVANAATDTGHGTVKFTGSIIDAPCGISADTQNQDVPLGAVAQHALENGGTSTPADFHLTLTQCDTATITNGMTITFTGTADATNADELAFGAGSSAAGASIAITGPDGSVIPLATASSPIALNDGQNQLNFQAYLHGTGATVTPGTFTSVANFTLAYN